MIPVDMATAIYQICGFLMLGIFAIAKINKIDNRTFGYYFIAAAILMVVAMAAASKADQSHECCASLSSTILKNPRPVEPGFLIPEHPHDH
ncbi:MAG: hypothetical protein PHT60_13935 [Acidiphilium sp.]|nr:hypothetical protein [Acidiphilium sp.]MDD4936865.1 hypothetical protein [Acidiphilium sp.]